ncbi:ATP-binding protein [Thiolinea disciformis]|uniref:ATP-binding protein n=1 Tax=Thiolinea disciformis TaxID=125614 RepID=UPI00037D21F4|nr:ATP-binding protein [Thiolinea disciformis]
MMGSLRSRQLVSGFTIIVIGILILGILLSISIYQRKTDAIKEELERTATDLLGFIEFDHGRFLIPERTLDAAKNFISINKLEEDEKRRFAYIWNSETNSVVWSSLDNDGVDQKQVSTFFAYFNFPKLFTDPDIGNVSPAAKKLYSVPEFGVIDPTFKPEQYMVAAQKFMFRENADSQTSQARHYLFIVAESMSNVDKEIDDLVMIFSILFFASVILILIAQLASSFWVVAPIREFEEEVRSIELGEKEAIQQEYPEELVPIKNTINALIGYEKGQKQRYKDSLDDLAHSLKTPLAAIQSHLEGDSFKDLAPDHPGLAGIATEMEHMHEIISRQLRKAMVTSENAIIMAQPIRPILTRLATTMRKVHRDKDFEIRINVDEYAKCRLDSEDLMELFGNLINNACRFCDRLVEVSSHRDNDMVVIDIDDDGMGFPSENPAKLLKRGIREDSKTEGQGIGLAVSTEIVAAVGGKIELLVSPYVGARVRLYLPA